jgi:hypothetical protein
MLPSELAFELCFLKRTFDKKLVCLRGFCNFIEQVKKEKPEGPTSGSKEERPQTTGSSTAIVIF